MESHGRPGGVAELEPIRVRHWDCHVIKGLFHCGWLDSTPSSTGNTNSGFNREAACPGLACTISIFGNWKLSRHDIYRPFEEQGFGLIQAEPRPGSLCTISQLGNW